jgi:transposase
VGGIARGCGLLRGGWGVVAARRLAAGRCGGLFWLPPDGTPHPPDARPDRQPRAAAPAARRPPTLPATATAADVIPDELWEAIRPLLPTPRQTNRAGQRADLRAVVAGAVCTEVLGVPGRHLPPALGADRKTVRTRLRRWQADTTWTAVRSVLDDSPHLRQLRTAVPRAAA